MVATVTADGRPLAGPVDGYFLHGSFWFSSGRNAVRMRHLRSRPGISATHLPGEALRRWPHIYHARNVADHDVVISFGLFNGSLDELREAQARLGRQSQVDRIDPHVREVLLDGSYEVVEEPIPDRLTGLASSEGLRSERAT